MHPEGILRVYLAFTFASLSLDPTNSGCFPYLFSHRMDYLSSALHCPGLSFQIVLAVYAFSFLWLLPLHNTGACAYANVFRAYLRAVGIRKNQRATDFIQTPLLGSFYLGYQP